MSFFVDKRLIFFFKKDSRLGPASLTLLIPFFAKNSRLGYFFNAKNLHGEWIAVSAMSFFVDKRLIFFEEKDETFIRNKKSKKDDFLILFLS